MDVTSGADFRHMAHPRVFPCSTVSPVILFCGHSGKKIRGPWRGLDDGCRHPREAFEVSTVLVEAGPVAMGGGSGGG